ncbi:hypothetical protein PPSIR1_16830 [Plesiocystis pacifica SIR-1]|uniref:Cip1-like core domain-containing protein n=1 Tax=Plesiocystis pacifica SIR-1 TaxID=391625 RepID=A6GKA0_9BACT|nr:hypothetical protein [Plesiocystis pacifica]EDM73706.1 hypothetical protein PPSIR1_16830 [Plesiocystis pacifica SIR-1]
MASERVRGRRGVIAGAVAVAALGCSGSKTEAGDEAAGSGSCPVAALVCEDFEGQPLGQAPGAPWTPEGEGTALVDDQRAFGGRHSLRLETTAGWDGRALLGLSDAALFPTTHLFGRARLYLTEASPDGVHWTMVQASGPTEAEGVWDGPFTAELRYGGQHQQRLMANYDTPGTYDTPPAGPASDCWQHSQTVMPQGQWTCMEWEFDAETDTMRLWFDGAAIEDLTVGTMGEGCVNPGTAEVWYYPDSFEAMHIGWVDYQNTGGSRELWIDDVALGTERMGCD